MSLIIASYQKATRDLAFADQTLNSLDDVEGTVHRCYYAMYHMVRAALFHVMEEPGKTHKGVHVAFSKHFVATSIVSKEQYKQFILLP